MESELDAADRLELLLPWLNVDHVAEDDKARRDHNYRERFSTTEVRHRLQRFVRAFDGGAESGYARVGKIDWRPQSWRTPFRVPELPKVEQSNSEEMVQEWLRWLLRSWLLNGNSRIPTPTLSFGVEGEGGIYTLVVSGSFPDVVIYLVGFLLSTSAIEVKACIAPAPSTPGKPNSWKVRCGKWFIAPTGGTPKECCTDGCRGRKKAELDSRESKSNKTKKKRGKKR